MKLPYFKISAAFDEAKKSFSHGNNSDKLTSSAKLVGKSFANVGMLAIEAGVEVIKRAPEITGAIAKDNLEKRSHLMTDEQIQNARTLVEKGDESKAQRLEKERLAEEEKRKLAEAEKKENRHNFPCK